MTGRFSSKKVLITGATGGIGQALAHAFYQEGAHLCLSGRNPKVLQELYTTFQPRCSVWPLELGDSSATTTMVEQIATTEGGIEILINNGGLTQDGFFFRMKDEQWDEVIKVNLTGSFYLSREVSKQMMRKKSGRIINIASIVGCSGNPGQANYSASKAGVIALTKTMALELARWNITANAIAPGYIDTSMTQHLPETLVESIPCKRYGTPQDIAFAALFLADDRASYITGQTVHVNGGLGMF
jgi:3-oxoacyl-[acyl-carrier protein] reductase